MSVVVIIMLVSSISIGFVIGRMSIDDRPAGDAGRRKPAREKTATSTHPRPVRNRPLVSRKNAALYK